MLSRATCPFSVQLVVMRPGTPQRGLVRHDRAFRPLPIFSQPISSQPDTDRSLTLPIFSQPISSQPDTDRSLTLPIFSQPTSSQPDTDRPLTLPIFSQPTSSQPDIDRPLTLPIFSQATSSSFAVDSPSSQLFQSHPSPLADDARSIDFQVIPDSTTYFYEYILQCKLFVMWPARTGALGIRHWNIDEVFVFLNELGPSWSTHDNGRYRVPKRSDLTSPYFQFTFDSPKFPGFDQT
jgi:hypothetical protein